MKEAYLSPSQFLSASDLPIAFPDSLLRDPLSSLNTLIKLSNMTTFLYLLLSSTPDAQGNRPARSSVWLKQAADHFLTHVVPVDSAIHDGILKMLVHLKCQVRPNISFAPHSILTKMYERRHTSLQPLAAAR
jgi:hypothetical protein